LTLSFVAFSQGASANEGAYSAMVARHAAANGLPASLVHRVIMRESRYNPRAVSKGNYGMMQIRLGTARAMGYRGDASGLLDPETNMTYAVKYLAGAYRAAGGSHDRAVSNYARGYYYAAKAQGFSPYAQPAMVQQPTFALASAPDMPSVPAEFSPEARKSYASSGLSRKARRALQRQEAQAFTPYGRYTSEAPAN
jgi:soluble lytic murein transglycosylase-like protein